MGQPSPSPDEVVTIGSVLDSRYRIDAVLGTGGMGRVYRGEHTGIGRTVAIKVLHADLGRNREAAARFQREALASGRLDHPNIVGVSDFGVLDQGACYLVMEALEGESLGARLDRTPQLPWREAIAIMRGVLAGLRHAHDRGVVHRDIKPDNIFLALKDGELVVKILDFGIAKLYAGSGDDPATTRAGLTVGTPAYLSPEQAVGGEITPASDLYSASIVLFEMIAGRTPFVDGDPLAMLGAHVGKPPPHLADVAPDLELPDGLDALVQHGLAKLTADRIASAGEYLTLLDDLDPIAVPMRAIASSPAIAAIGIAPTALKLQTPSPAQTPDPTAKPVAAQTPWPAEASAPVSTEPPPQTPAPRTSALAAIALPDAPPIPKAWLRRGGIAIAAAALFTIAVALATRPHDEPKLAPVPKPAPKPPPPAPKPAPQVTTPPPPPSPPSDDVDSQLKAALHELENGKTCADRKAAIPELVELHDARALAPLRAARYRMRGGILGFNQENTNACLHADAEAAIKALTPPK